MLAGNCGGEYAEPLLLFDVDGVEHILYGGVDGS